MDKNTLLLIDALKSDVLNIDIIQTLLKQGADFCKAAYSIIDDNDPMGLLNLDYLLINENIGKTKSTKNNLLPEMYQNVLKYLTPMEQTRLLKSGKIMDIRDIQQFYKISKKQYKSLNSELKKELSKSKKNYDLIKSLILQGANPNVQDKRGFTLLMTAIHELNTEMVQFLLEHGANPNIKNSLGRTALFDLISRLGEIYGINWQIKNFEYLFEQNKIEKIKTKKSELREYEILKKFQMKGYNILEMLLDAGGDPNITANDGLSIWEMAYDDILQLLYRYGLRNKANDEDIIEKFLRNYYGEEDVKKYLENGGDPNVKDKNGNTLLHKINLYHFDQEIIQLLINNGADPNIPNNEGETAISMIKKHLNDKYNSKYYRKIYDIYMKK